MVSSGNKTGTWTLYRCNVTVRHKELSDLKLVIGFVVCGQHYAIRVVNRAASIYYAEVTVYYDGQKLETLNDVSDAQLEAYLDGLVQ